MGDRREDDLSAIAWPGFVDILSAVIIMFVFFVMIVATALYFHILIFTSKVKSDEAAEDVVAENQYKFTQLQTQFAESTEQTMSVDSDNKSLVVFFGTDSISVLPEIKEQLDTNLKKYFADGGADGYDIRVHIPKSDEGLINITKEISVARMLNVRNTLIDAGFNPQSIRPKMVDAYSIEEKDHWIKIEMVKR